MQTYYAPNVEIGITEVGWKPATDRQKNPNEITSTFITLALLMISKRLHQLVA